MYFEPIHNSNHMRLPKLCFDFITKFIPLKYLLIRKLVTYATELIFSIKNLVLHISSPVGRVPR